MLIDFSLFSVNKSLYPISTRKTRKMLILNENSIKILSVTRSMFFHLHCQTKGSFFFFSFRAHPIQQRCISIRSLYNIFRLLWLKNKFNDNKTLNIPYTKWREYCQISIIFRKRNLIDINYEMGLTAEMAYKYLWGDVQM